MPTFGWSGLGLSDGTVMDGTTLNAAGNGDTLSYRALTNGATRVTRQEAQGNGVEITGPATSEARLDTSIITGGAECMAIQAIYKAPAAPTVDHMYLFIGRNANATPGFAGYLAHMTTNLIQVRDANNTPITGGSSPTLVAGDYYQIDYALIRNTTTTPSTSNGRVMVRVRSISAPGTWNSGAEFYFDTGYAANVSVDKTNLFRTGKTSTAGAVATFRLLNLKWRSLDTPATSTTKATAITNFVLATGPTISTTGTGNHYLIYAVGTAGSGGALSYSIVQTVGNPQTPVVVAPGVWRVDQDTAGPLTYTATVSEVGAGDTSTTVVVPQAAAVASGQFRRRVLIAGVWT